MRIIYQLLAVAVVLFTLACATYLIVNTEPQPFVEEGQS